LAASDVQICNLALLRIGEKQQVGDLGDNSTPAKACSVLYPMTRDTLLAKTDWHWARKHAVLGLLTYARSGWKFVYALPDDLVKCCYVSNGNRPGASYLSNAITLFGYANGYFNDASVLVTPAVPFDVELGDSGKRVLVTDQENAELIYTSSATDPGSMPPLFVDALAWQLAAELSLALPNKIQNGVALQKKADMALMEAMAQGLRETEEDPQPPSRYITGRR
jgi:hypothetical protein